MHEIFEEVLKKYDLSHDHVRLHHKDYSLIADALCEAIEKAGQQVGKSDVPTGPSQSTISPP